MYAYKDLPGKWGGGWGRAGKGLKRGWRGSGKGLEWSGEAGWERTGRGWTENVIVVTVGDRMGIGLEVVLEFGLEMGLDI